MFSKPLAICLALVLTKYYGIAITIEVAVAAQNVGVTVWLRCWLGFFAVHI